MAVVLVVIIATIFNNTPFPAQTNEAVTQRSVSFLWNLIELPEDRGLVLCKQWDAFGIFIILQSKGDFRNKPVTKSCLSAQWYCRCKLLRVNNNL